MKFIERFIKKDKSIIHGRRALNKQMPKKYHRITNDWDLFNKNPHTEAEKLEKYLDKKAGYDRFDEIDVNLKDSKQKVHKVIDKKSFGNGDVADFMKTPKIKNLYITIDNLRYEKLQRAKRVYKKILANPELKHRWVKTRFDLQSIEKYEQDLKKGVKNSNFNMLIG